MKKIAITLSLLVLYCISYSNQWVTVTSDKPEKAKIKLVMSDIESSVIHYKFGGFYKNKVQTPKGEAYYISLPKATAILKKGAPDLPKFTASVIIPDLARMKTEIISVSFKEFKNIEIAPSKGILTRDIDPETVPYTYGTEYETNAFFPEINTDLRDPYIIRDYRGQTIIVYPFQYNPVTKTLKVFYDIKVRISKVDDNGKNQLIRKKPLEKVNREFTKLYSRHFINAGASRYTPVDENGDMLIISYGSFMDEMESFIDWKIQTGMPVEIVDVAEIGNDASSIKSYIRNYYNENDLAFVLLVGDAAQVTPSYSSGDSDNEYTYLVGDDHYPDLFIGRFSAEDEDHVNTQVNRSIKYEKDPYVDEDWFTTGIGIASSQGTGDDNEYDYEHIRNINSDLLDFTYTYCHELFDGSQGGEDASGNPTPSMVADAINDGSSIINYCGHGSTSSWSTSGFSISDVNNLTNTGMLPFIWSVACVNGNFVGGTCFAEAWLRAEDNGEPTGAIATLMSTINQSWSPPMCGQDEMVDILVESYSDNIKRKFASLSMNGCMQMNDEYGSQGEEMTDTWTVFGDPSVMVRTDLPEELEATYSSVTFIGTDEFTVYCDVEGALVCLTLEGEILDTEFVEGGKATLEFEKLEDYGTITITITAFNYIPEIGEIEIISPEGPYCIYHSYDINDNNGNGNGCLDYNENVFLSLTLENLGNSAGLNVETTINTLNNYITINDNSDTFDSIPSKDTATAKDGYEMSTADYVPDMTEAFFTVKASNSDTTWESNFVINIHAPVIHIKSLTIIDTVHGNGNGVFDPGETVDIKIENSNTGHCAAFDPYATLTSSSPYLTFENTEDSVANIPVLGSKYAYFTITADSATPQGELVNFQYDLSFAGYNYSKNYQVEIGMLFEDWESGDFSKFDWQFDGDKNWKITSSEKYEKTYSARSGNITNNESSILKINIDADIDDTISFYVKTSSETGRDVLTFMIGNSNKGEWSGMTDWQHASFPVSAGSHTLKWKYSKDDLISFGDDCAWIDYIVFPPMPILSAFAGKDDYTCTGSDFQCSGIAENYTSLEWTTSGDGSFDDPTVLDPYYSPGYQDVESGSVSLTLTAYNDDRKSDSDNMILSITDEPSKPNMPSGPEYVDVYSTTSSKYTTNSTSFTEYYEWKIEPGEAGEISGTDTIGYVEWNAEFVGTAFIYVQSINDCGESPFSEGLEVTVDNTVGIDKESQSDNIKIYPNPTTGQFFIELPEIKEKTSLYIYDLTGSVKYKTEINANDEKQIISYNFDHFANGIYFVSINTDKARIIKKLIIK